MIKLTDSHGRPLGSTVAAAMSIVLTALANMYCIVPDTKNPVRDHLILTGLFVSLTGYYVSGLLNDEIDKRRNPHPAAAIFQAAEFSPQTALEQQIAFITTLIVPLFTANPVLATVVLTNFSVLIASMAGKYLNATLERMDAERQNLAMGH